MSASTPEETHELFASYFNAGDLDAVMSLYEPDAALSPQPDVVVNGHAAIREALAGFLALKGNMNLQPDKVMKSNDVALLISNWTLKATDPEGNPIELSGRTSDVVRRQSDGTWLFAIDNPYGTQ